MNAELMAYLMVSVVIIGYGIYIAIVWITRAE